MKTGRGMKWIDYEKREKKVVNTKWKQGRYDINTQWKKEKKWNGHAMKTGRKTKWAGNENREENEMSTQWKQVGKWNGWGLDDKVSESIDIVSGGTQGSVLGPLLFMLYTSEFLLIVGNHIVGHADDTTIYAVMARSLSRPQVMESLNRGFDSHQLTPGVWSGTRGSKTKSMVVSKSLAIALGYGDLTLGGA